MSHAASGEPDAGGQSDELALYRRATALLARRDHSAAELRRKLRTRGGDDDAIEAIIERLQCEKVLDDARYAAVYVEQRIARRQGPLLIRARLLERGLSSVLVDEALAAFDGEWEAVATQAILRRFDLDTLGAGEPHDNSRTASRVVRFLAARGFDRGQALRAFRIARAEAAGSAEP